MKPDLLHMQAVSPPSVSRLSWWIIACGFAVFCLIKLWAIYGGVMDYDSGYLGMIAKNVLTGYGYASSHNERILFNPEISTGPAAIFPLAGVMAVVGNLEFLPQYYILGSNLVLLGLFSVLFVRAYGANRYSAGFLIGIYLLGVFFEPIWWHVVADMQVLLLILNLSLIIGTPELVATRRQALFLGFLIAFGVLLRFSFFLALPALMLGLATQVFRSRIKLNNMFLVVIAFMVFYFPFHIYKNIEISRLPVFERDKLQSNALMGAVNRQAAGVGIFLKTDKKLQHIRKSFNRTTATLDKIFSGYGMPKFFMYAVFLCVIFASFYYLLKIFSNPVNFPVLIAWISASFMAWKFLLSLAFQSKFSLPFIWLSIIYVFFIAAFNFRFFLAPLLTVSILPFVMSADVRSSVLAEYFHTQSDAEYRKETSLIADFISQRPVRPPLAYCGWGAIPRPVLYLLPESETSPECYSALGKQLVQAVDHSVSWNAEVSYWLLGDKRLISLYPADARRYERIKAVCRQPPLFEGTYYELYDCSWDRLKLVSEDSALVQDILEYQRSMQ